MPAAGHRWLLRGIWAKTQFERALGELGVKVIHDPLAAGQGTGGKGVCDALGPDSQGGALGIDIDQR